MNKKPGFIQKAEKVLAGKGFYMVLLLCLVILGASGFFLYRTVTGLSPRQDAQNTGAGATITVTSPKVDTTPDEAETETLLPVEEEAEVIAPVEETVAEPESAEEAAAPVEEVPAVEPVPVLSWPVQGDVVAAFSSSELTYNEAMGDWRAHTGMDIAADLGAEVLAAADGTVESIANDALTGTTLTLSHSGGMKSVYGNLDPDAMGVSEGDTVSAGQALGCVGSSAAGESSTGAYLHFAVTLDGESVDPADYLG